MPKKIQMINEAYQYLLSYEGYNNSNDISENDYSNILFYFLNSIISEEKNMHVIINKINNLCEDKAIEYLKTLDTNLLFKIYDILFKYKNAFHMKANFIDEVKNYKAKNKK